MTMDIRQIVETTLVAPMRIAELQQLVDAKQTEIQRLNSLLDSYRRDNVEHERLIGMLYLMMRTEKYDDAADLVRAEYDSIHGPRE